MNARVLGNVLGQPIWLWGMFFALVGVLLALDLGVLHRGQREISVKESLVTCAGYMLVALLFGGLLATNPGGNLGLEDALQYFTGYAVEFSLSLDNVFVMAVILGFFGIPRRLQHRVLFWGVLGALLLRGLMIIAGAALVVRFEWVLYFFAIFLVLTGMKILWDSDPTDDEQEMDAKLAKNPLLVWCRKQGWLSEGIHGGRFMVKTAGKWAATPLLAALVVVEVADVVFAVDSVPAIFAITTDPFLVLTSNVMAILGLRSLYFGLSAMMARFAYLKYALGLVLLFIGLKIGLDGMGLHVPHWLALLVTVGLLGGGVAYSWWRTETR